MILVDTNLLVRLSMASDPQHASAHAALKHLPKAGRIPCITPQVLYEHWVVATRPKAANGLGLEAYEATELGDEILYKFLLLEDRPGVFLRWRRLVERHRITGKWAHDVRLIASMEEHGVSNLITFNIHDFTGIPGIAVVHPDDVQTQFPIP